MFGAFYFLADAIPSRARTLLSKIEALQWYGCICAAKSEWEHHTTHTHTHRPLFAVCVCVLREERWAVERWLIVGRTTKGAQKEGVEWNNWRKLEVILSSHAKRGRQSEYSFYLAFIYWVLGGIGIKLVSGDAMLYSLHKKHSPTYTPIHWEPA